MPFDFVTVSAAAPSPGANCTPCGRSSAAETLALSGASRRRRRFLLSRQSLVLDDAEGTVVAVESGCLWLTMENDTRDIVLSPGMRFEIDRTGRTIVAAEEDTRFRLFAPKDAHGIAARIVRAIRQAIDRLGARRVSEFVPYY
jgi:Protein of unknown function (DUF2917)